MWTIVVLTVVWPSRRKWLREVAGYGSGDAVQRLRHQQRRLLPAFSSSQPPSSSSSGVRFERKLASGGERVGTLEVRPL